MYAANAPSIALPGDLRLPNLAIAASAYSPLDVALCGSDTPAASITR